MGENRIRCVLLRRLWTGNIMAPISIGVIWGVLALVGLRGWHFYVAAVCGLALAIAGWLLYWRLMFNCPRCSSNLLFEPRDGGWSLHSYTIPPDCYCCGLRLDEASRHLFRGGRS